MLQLISNLIHFLEFVKAHLLHIWHFIVFLPEVHGTPLDYPFCLIIHCANDGYASNEDCFCFVAIRHAQDSFSG